MACTYNGVLFSLKKEGNSATCYGMDEPWGHDTRWNEPSLKANSATTPLTWSPGVLRVTEKQRAETGARAGRGRTASNCLLAIGFGFTRRRVMETEAGDGCRTRWILPTIALQSFPGGSDGKESACHARNLGSIPGLGRSPWRREWLLALIFLPGEFHGQRRLADYIAHGVAKSWTRLSD